MICSKSPQPLSHFHICPKPKVKLGPIDSSYPAPPSSDVIATATNPNQFGLTDGISVSPKWACKLSVTYCNNFSPTEICNQSHRVCLTNSLFSYYRSRSYRVYVIGLTEITLFPNPNHIGPTELHVGPTENPNGH